MLSADQVQGDALVSTPQTIKEKVEMNARDDGGQTGGTANLTKIIGKVRKPVKIMGEDGNELELEARKQVAQNKTFDDKPEVEEMVSSVLDVVIEACPWSTSSLSRVLIYLTITLTFLTMLQPLSAQQ